MRKPFDDFDAEEREMVRQTGLDRVGCPQFELLLAAEAGVLERGRGYPAAGTPVYLQIVPGSAFRFASGNRERQRRRTCGRCGLSSMPVCQKLPAQPGGASGTCGWRCLVRRHASSSS